MRLSNNDLQEMLESIVCRFFDHRIHDVRAKFGKIKEQGIFLHNEKLIIIHEDFKKHPDIALIILGHELVHVLLVEQGYVGHMLEKSEEEGHSTKFHVEMDKLYHRGFYEGLLTVFI